MHEDRRFAPPTAPLRDVDAEREIAERPVQVRWASALLWVSLVVGAALAVYELNQPKDVAELALAVDAVLIGITVGEFAVAAFLNVMIYKGHNWARIFYAVLVVAAMGLLLFPTDEARAVTTVETIAYAFVSLLDIAAMALVFTRPGALWFRRRRY